MKSKMLDVVVAVVAPRKTTLLLLVVLVLLAALRRAESFVQLSQHYHNNNARTTKGATYLFMNMFGDMLNKAFANDSSLSRDDKVTGQLEGPGDEYNNNNNDENASSRTLTATQQKWRQQMLSSSMVTEDDLLNKSIQLDFYLTGIPNKDPSNDLFGSRVNISLRDRQIGLALPEKPTVSGVQIQFLKDGKCQVVQGENSSSSSSSSSGSNKNQQFVQGNELGDWILSKDGGSSQIRFRIAVTGYSRRIETKGTIQKVYWSKEEEKTTATSTSYSIPAGWLYGEATLSKRINNRDNRPVVQWGDENGGGILKVEQSMGLLGVASKMTPCGKFTVLQMVDDKSVQ